MKTLRIGIGSAADVKAYKAALARRRLWGMAGEPESWVSSAQSLGKLLDENWPLLREIRRRPPRSMSRPTRAIASTFALIPAPNSRRARPSISAGRY